MNCGPSSSLPLSRCGNSVVDFPPWTMRPETLPDGTPSKRGVNGCALNWNVEH